MHSLCLFILLLLGLPMSKWGAAINLSPNPGTIQKWDVDTADLRYLSPDWGGFSIHWSDPMAVIDSVRFEIDSVSWEKRCPVGGVDGGLDSVNQVAWMRLNRQAYPCLDSSIHHVTARFRMNGIRMEVEWHFRLFLRQYQHAETVLEIIGELDEPLEKEFKVISAIPIDTALWEAPKGFRFFPRIQGRELRALTKYRGTRSCCHERIDGVIGEHFTSFLHMMGHDSTGWQWQISSSRYDLLRDTGQVPFPFTDAQKVMNQYGIGVKLGPTFPEFGHSREAYAYPSGRFWEIQENSGSGDCMAGCISSSQRLIRIAAYPELSGVCITTSPFFPSMPSSTICHGDLDESSVQIRQSQTGTHRKQDGFYRKLRGTILLKNNENILGRKMVR